MSVDESSVDEEIEAMGITVAPGWEVYANSWRREGKRPARGDVHITMRAPGIAPCPYGITPPDHLFPSGLDIECQARASVDPKVMARSIIAALAVGALHEGLEWVMVDGQRLAEPHPDYNNNDPQVWDWLYDRMMRLISDYEKRWPAAEES